MLGANIAVKQIPGNELSTLSWISYRGVEKSEGSGNWYSIALISFVQRFSIP